MSQQTFTEAELNDVRARLHKYGPAIYREGDLWQDLDAALTYAATLMRRLENHNLRIERLDAIRLKWEALMNSVPWRLAALGYRRAYTQFNADRKAEDDPPDVIRWLLNRADLYTQRERAARCSRGARIRAEDDGEETMSQQQTFTEADFMRLRTELLSPNGANASDLANALTYAATLVRRLDEARAVMIRAMDALESDTELDARREAFEMIQARFEDCSEAEHERAEAMIDKLRALLTPREGT